MANVLSSLFGRAKRRNVSPTQTVGAPGVALINGEIDYQEKNAAIGSHDSRYKTFSEILANTSIVAAGTRYFLNLVAKAEWSFTPSEADKSGEYAELAEELIMDDPDTPFHRIVRRAAMYRFYGFSVQEWTAKRREDGRLTMADIAPRAQVTITRWDTDATGKVQGVIQTDPRDYHEIYLPRNKLMYLVDDTLSDSPEGLGLFRHLVSPAQRLARYEQLEGIGFETDLRGIPIGRGPFTDLASQVTAGTLTNAQRETLEGPMRRFINGHVKNKALGLLLDSETYETKDEAGRPSSAKKWDLELLKGTSTSFAENAAAIERLNREMARILGTDQLLLGDGAGSYALSKDKTNSFFLLVDGSLVEIREAVKKDILDRVWMLNGFPEEMKPEPNPEAVRHTDVEEVAGVLRDMASAGAVLAENDPVIAEVRELMGVSRPPEVTTSLEDDEDAALRGKVQNSAAAEEPDMDDVDSTKDQNNE